MFTPEGGLSERDPPMLRMPDVYISNTSPDHAVTLKFALEIRSTDGIRMTLSGDGQGGIGRTLGKNDLATKLYAASGGEGATFLLSPVTIKPQETAHGPMAFVVTAFGMNDELDQQLLGTLVGGSLGMGGKAKFTYALHLEDVVSGHSITVPLPTGPDSKGHRASPPTEAR